MKTVNRMHRALVVEDQNLMRLALMDQISTAFENTAVLGAQTLEIALYELAKENFDLVIIDPGLPGFDPTSQDDRLSVVHRIIEASPAALHVVITGSDNMTEAEQFRGLGAVAYLGKTGLEPGMLGDVLDDISTSGFSIRLSKVTMTVPDYFHSALTPREQEVITLMARREPGMSRTQIYEQVAGKLGIDRDSAEKYFKKARAKIMKSDHKLPVGI
ncbi:transcriptional regulatory protein TctD [Devosia sp. LC5]|uniref:response regulator n=1 Tax=Devosia sp. LC5 TaxID=1502724 RepID=UPI0004E36672|nr:response regulator [Devosia sp. LC5]KFC70185.1 transcriptional regulatory protein TctD [Devosia sp. LC5]